MEHFFRWINFVLCYLQDLKKKTRQKDKFWESFFLPHRVVCNSLSWGSYLEREQETLETPLYFTSRRVLRDPLPEWHPLEVLEIHLWARSAGRRHGVSVKTVYVGGDNKSNVT